MSIPISQKHGVNPTLCICENCGKETGSLLLPGRVSKFKCRCGKDVYGRRHMGYGFNKNMDKCPGCGATCDQWTLVEADVEMPRHVPYGFCDDCEQMFKEHKAIVEKGGIYWKCKDCRSSGVIRETSPLAQAVRIQMKIEPPNPVGIEFSKDHQCPVCSKDKVTG